MVGSLDYRAVLIGLVLVDLVSHLRSGLASAELPAKPETGVPVDSDLPPIDSLQVKTVKCLLCFFPSGVLDEAEPARSLLHLVESHYQVDHLTALAKELK